MKNSAYKEYIKDRKTIMTLVSMSFGFGLVVLLSFGTRFYFKQIDTSFWSTFALSLALCIYSLFFGIPEGKNLYSKKENGRFAIARQNFLNARAESSKRDNEFNQWLDNYYNKSKRDYYCTILSMHGIRNSYVLDLDLTELDNLKNPYYKEWDKTEFKGRAPTYFTSCTDEQIEIIKKCQTGKIAVEKIPSDFFKTMNGKIVLSEYVEQSRLSKKASTQYILLIFYRIIMLFLMSFVFAVFGYEIGTTTDPNEIIGRTIDTVSRLFTMISSFVYGFGVGQIMIGKESDKLEFKYRINKAFCDDKSFVYLTEEEIAKREFEKYNANNYNLINKEEKEDDKTRNEIQSEIKQLPSVEEKKSNVETIQEP